jgi:hypothetical protein
MLASFSSKGEITKIGNVIQITKSVKYLEVSIKMYLSGQELNFYLTDTESSPQPFQLIRKHFDTGYENLNFKIGEQIQFDFNIIQKEGKSKLKIWSIYNRGCDHTKITK